MLITKMVALLIKILRNQLILIKWQQREEIRTIVHHFKNMKTVYHNQNKYTKI
jgi:hypothetical protein